jgi:hypothetical protein
MTHFLRKARKRGPRHQQSQLKSLGSISLMMLSLRSPQSLLSPRKVQRVRRKRRRRIPIQMTISSMKRTIISRRSYYLRVETTMIFSGTMMAISHNLPKRKRRRRSRSQHSTQVSIVDPLSPRLLLEETKE